MVPRAPEARGQRGQLPPLPWWCGGSTGAASALFKKALSSYILYIWSFCLIDLFAIWCTRRRRVLLILTALTTVWNLEESHSLRWHAYSLRLGCISLQTNLVPRAFCHFWTEIFVPVQNYDKRPWGRGCLQTRVIFDLFSPFKRCMILVWYGKCFPSICLASCHPSAHLWVYFELHYCMYSLKFELRPVDWWGLNWATSKPRSNICNKVAQNTLSWWKDGQMAK